MMEVPQTKSASEEVHSEPESKILSLLVDAVVDTQTSRKTRSKRKRNQSDDEDEEEKEDNKDEDVDEEEKKKKKPVVVTSISLYSEFLLQMPLIELWGTGLLRDFFSLQSWMRIVIRSAIEALNDCNSKISADNSFHDRYESLIGKAGDDRQKLCEIIITLLTKLDSILISQRKPADLFAPGLLQLIRTKFDNE